MGRDEVCILCGIRPYGGPGCFGATEDIIAQIADDVHAEGFADRRLSPFDVPDMLREIFQQDLAGLDPSYHASLHPGYNKDCIAIGHFDHGGGYEPCRHAGQALHPPGDDVEVRRVTNESTAASFTTVVELVRGARVLHSAWTTCTTCGPSACNIWLHVGCWGHLQHWLACTLPPRIRHTGPPLSLAGELYEITASRREPQDEYCGSLPAVDYGGALDAFMGTQYQDYILGPRRGAQHLARALSAGLCGTDLVPALMEDVRFWMWARPDMCVRPPPFCSSG